MKSCFAYRETVDDDNTIRESCRCFKIMLCKYKECPLQETAEQHRIRADKAKVRNKKLGIEAKYVRDYEYAGVKKKTGG